MFGEKIERRALTIEELGRKVPSILATKPIDDVSKKYTFVSTVDAIELIQSAGWMPYAAKQSNVRKDTKAGFQSHLVKFTRNESLSDDDKERFDLLLFNSHDKGTAFKLSMGVFRFVCANGLIVGREDLEFRHKHIGFDEQSFMTSVSELSNQGRVIAESVADYKQIELTRNEQGIYAQSAAQIITDTPENMNTYDILRPRREQDRQDNLWATYNRVQENVMKGGIRRKKQTRTRKVKALKKDAKINKALWLLTEKMAELKAN
jgi:hypothetical protein